LAPTNSPPAMLVCVQPAQRAVVHRAQEPADPPAWVEKLRDLESPEARAWSSALAALRMVNEQVSVDELYDPFDCVPPLVDCGGFNLRVQIHVLRECA